MKILHTSDLHIGKHVNEEPMLDEQRKALDKIASLANDVDAVILAGDIYDRSVPAAEAVTLFDDFLVKLARQKKPVFIISGNHDSPERLAFASSLIKACDVYISPVYDGHVEPIVLKDGNREVAFYLLPFIRPSMVQPYVDDDTELKTFEDAVRFAIGKMDIDPSRTNIIVSHQFITDAERSESEDVMVGGLDNVSADVFKQFDYVALGHLHRPQSCGRETVRYSGTPLKYSFSEIEDEKSVSIIDINDTGELSISETPLEVGREWHDLYGSFERLMDPEYYTGKGYQDAYVRITLTDNDEIHEVRSKLKAVYHNLLELNFDNERTRSDGDLKDPVQLGTPFEMFADLFEKQNNLPMNEKQTAKAKEYIDQIFTKH